MEWPELVEELLPDETLRIHLVEQADGSRLLTFDL
jgi:tRNA threonylcarbamoyladenosine biosynthesis protein TsaE